MFTITYSKLKF